MEIFNIKNLSFKYNNSNDYALKNINLKIKRGEFLLIIGSSGSGKTTLLRMLKKELTPLGEKIGDIFYKGDSLDNLSGRKSASEIGFIMQDPESQVVTDKVYSELAFGLENLGYKRESIRSKVAELSSCFGFSDIIGFSTDKLSGGEKQLLNLASVTAMNPEVIILDEPVSMLDPIYALKLIDLLKQLNDDFGVTVIVAEHHLQDIFRYADRVLCIDNGEITAGNSPYYICAELKNSNIEATLPVPARLFNRLNVSSRCPITVKEGRALLSSFKVIDNISIEEIKRSDIAISCKNLYFRYEKNGRDILKGLNLNVYKGEIYSLLGENGCGKSTLLNIINGNLKPFRGKVRYDSGIAYLPQNPKYVFTKDKLADDLMTDENNSSELIGKLELNEILGSHPYDLSGGELQRAAICKILLNDPDIILLDEPTKGLDTYAKNKLGAILKKLARVGKTVLLVSHDLEFCAEYSDRCGLLFSGEITSEDFTKEFFGSNIFFTTAASKMSKSIIKNAVTIEDILRCIDD